MGITNNSVLTLIEANNVVQAQIDKVGQLGGYGMSLALVCNSVDYVAFRLGKSSLEVLDLVNKLVKDVNAEMGYRTDKEV